MKLTRYPLRRSHSISISLMAALVAASAGWWLGRGNRHSVVEEPSALVASPLPPPALAGARSTLPAEVQAWLREIGREKSPSLQAAVAAQLAARLTPDEWPVMLAHLEYFSSLLVRDVLQAAVVRRWVEADPVGAARDGLPRFGFLASAGAAAWVTRDAEAATAWFESLTPAQRAMVQEAFYPALARQDPEACLTRVLAHRGEPGFDLSWAEDALASAVPETVLELADNLEGEMRQTMREAAARALGQRDLMKAIAWAQAQPDALEMLQATFEQRTIPWKELLSALAHLPPEQQGAVAERISGKREDAFTRLDALEQPLEGLTRESRQQLVHRISRDLVLQAPQEAVRRLMSLHSDTAPAWISTVAWEWGWRDPEASRAWIDTLSEGELREEAMKVWTKASVNPIKDEEEFDPVQEALTNLSKPPKKVFRDGQLGTLSPEARRQLWEQTSTLPDLEQAHVRQNMFALQATIDPVEAAAWITSQEGTLSAQLTSRLAAHWALHEAPAAASWVESLPDGEAKTWARWNLARQWERVDPVAARRWAENLPGPLRNEVEGAREGRRPQS